MKGGKFTEAEQSELGEHAPSCAGDWLRAGNISQTFLRHFLFSPRAVLGVGFAFIMVALGGQGHGFIFVLFFCFFLDGAF